MLISLIAFIFLKYSKNWRNKSSRLDLKIISLNFAQIEVWFDLNIQLLQADCLFSINIKII